MINAVMEIMAIVTHAALAFCILSHYFLLSIFNLAIHGTVCVCVLVPANCPCHGDVRLFQIST